MSKKLLIVSPLFLLFSLTVKAQIAPPCGIPPPPGAENCQSACVYCDFDGYTGTNNGTPSGGNTVCGAIALHNDQWFGFIAGTTDISIDILSSNCSTADGMQSAFFDACGVESIVCNPGSPGGAGQPLNLTYSGFVPGQTYYLMIDGYSGCVCDFEIDVINGSITPPPPGLTTQPEGPTMVCPGATVVYTIPDVDGAGYYQWQAPAGSSINGGGAYASIEAPDGTMVTITFGNSGGNVCVRAGNSCFPATAYACLPVVNTPVPPTIKPDVVLCAEDLPYTWDEEPYTTISNNGTYNLTSVPYDNYLGCDSLVKQKIIVKSQIVSNIGFQYLCPDQCFLINGNNYCNAGGPFTEIFNSFQNCDSLVNFYIVKIPASAVIEQPIPMISCNNPVLTLSSNGSSTGGNTMYSWTNASWTPIGSMSTQTVTNGGTYNLIVTNSGGTKTCKDTTTVTITGNTNPPGVTATGGVIGCLATNQSVTLTAVSPTGGVNYLWSGPGINAGNQNQQNPTVTTPGNYIVNVTNPTNSCVSSDTVVVVADNTPPQALATGGLITCGQASVTINSTTNISTAGYVWQGPGINAGNVNLDDPIVNVAGTYTVTITNTLNGCTNTTTALVDVNTTQPTASAGADQVINCLSANVVLNGSGDAGGAPFTFNWAGPGINAGNQNQATPSVNMAGTYILTITNSVNSCIKSDTVLVDASLNPPTAAAGADNTITCAVTSVTLNGGASTSGAGFSVLWQGPGITPANQNQYNPVVSVSGNYTLTVTNSQNGCTATDQVTVLLNTAVPTANAGADQTLTCSTNTGVVLSGSGTPANIDYFWTGPGIGSNNDTLANPTVTIDGLYTLQVTDQVNGCTSTDQVEVFQDAAVPDAAAGPDLTLNCTVNAVDIDGSGSTTGAGILYQWSGPGISGGNTNAQSPTGISIPGTYNLTVTNTINNCSNTDVVVVLIDTIQPTVSAGPDLILNCYNNSLDTLNASGSSTGANFVYTWTGNGITPATANLPQPPVSQAGTYTLQILNTVNNCTASDVATVNSDIAPPTAAAGTDKIIDCVVTSIQIGGISSSGPTFTYAWSGPGITPGNMNQATPTVNIDGTYTITVTNTTNGCTATDDALVTLNAVYPSTVAGADQIITCTNPVVVIDGSGSSTGPQFLYLWTGPGINAGNQNQAAPNVTTPGTYILRITDSGNSCATSDTVVVTQNTVQPVASAGPAQRLDCQILQVTLDGSGSSTGTNFNYLWQGPGITPASATQQSPVVTVPGTYTLLVTDTINGCTNQQSVLIDQNITAPVANAGQTFTLTCTQSTLPINGSGSSAGPLFTYIWQGPGINTGNYDQQSPMVSDSGTYILIVTNNDNKCTATDVVYVAQDGDFPLTEAGPQQLLTCALITAQLDGSQSLAGPGINYLWTGPGIVPGTETSITPTVNQPGIYTLTVTNTNNGCSETDVVTVNEDKLPPIANAGADPTLTCTTTTGVPVSGISSSTGPGYTLLWSGPGINAGNQNQIEPLVNVPGVYTLLVTNNNNGCTATDQVSVLQDQNLPVANAGPDLVINCLQTLVTLDATNSSATGPIEVLWSGPSINTNNEAQFQPVVNLSGTYSVVVTNTITGCTATDNAIVSLDTQQPQLTLSADTIDCANPNADVNVVSDLPNCSYDWQGPGIPTGTQTDSYITVDEPGSYTVVVVAPNGCSSTGNIVVQVDAAFPEGTVEGTVLNCFNNSTGSISAQITSPVGAVGHWNGPNGFFSNSLNPTVTVPGLYRFTIEAPNGCKRVINVTVPGEFDVPVAIADVPSLLDCNTPAITINGIGSSVGNHFTYDWTTTAGNIVSGATTLTPVVDAPGSYTMLITDTNNGCTNSVTVPVINDPEVPTAFDLTVQDVPCFGDENGFIIVNGITGGNAPFFFSLNGATASTTAQFTQLGAGSYTLQLEDANGCLLDTTVALVEPGELQVSLGGDQEIKLGESVSVDAIVVAPLTPVQNIIWSTVPYNPTWHDTLSYTIDQPLNSYIQHITVIDESGCVAEDNALIQVRKDRYIYVPSIFNPGSDNPINALLMIHGNIGVARVISWNIFDRWGEIIWSVKDFQPDDPTFAWDGRFNGKTLTPSVFIWVAEVEFVDGEKVLFKGDVTLSR